MHSLLSRRCHPLHFTKQAKLADWTAGDDGDDTVPSPQFHELNHSEIRQQDSCDAEQEADIQAGLELAESFLMTGSISEIVGESRGHTERFTSCKPIDGWRSDDQPQDVYNDDFEETALLLNVQSDGGPGNEENQQKHVIEANTKHKFEELARWKALKDEEAVLWKKLEDLQRARHNRSKW